MFVPNAILVAVVIGEVLFVKSTDPLTTDQDPVPLTGVFPPKMAFDEQIIWFEPAIDVVGILLRITTVSEI